MFTMDVKQHCDDKVWIILNGKYFNYPKIDREQTWNFSLVLSIFKNSRPKCYNQWQRDYQYKCQGLDSEEWQISHISKIDCKQTWNFPSVLSIFDFKCKIINQNVVNNGSDIIVSSEEVWIVQNGKYLTYPKIDREQTWNFSLILSIFDFKCKI